MSKSYSKARVTMTQRELRERQRQRDAKRVSESAHIELLDRRFDYERRDIYEMLNMRHDTHYAE